MSHAEPFSQFIQHYEPIDWLQPILENYHSTQICQWMDGLGIDHYVGSSGRIFPTAMKAAPLLRAWLDRLHKRGVQFYYRHRCIEVASQCAIFEDNSSSVSTQQKVVNADAIVLACGGVSWPHLGSDGAWQQWLAPEHLKQFSASNVGVRVAWSDFMRDVLGQPLKRIRAWTAEQPAYFGEMVISRYGLEGGLVYRCNRSLSQQLAVYDSAILWLDLLPDLSQSVIMERLQQYKKQSLNTRWQRLGLDKAKIALLREQIPKRLWHDCAQISMSIKSLPIVIEGTQSIVEAISCAGGVRSTALQTGLNFRQQPWLFACGEMLDWDAPTGGYLLTACLATGRHAADGVYRFLSNPNCDL